MKLDITCLKSGNIVCRPEWEVTEDGDVYHRLYYVYGGKVLCKLHDKQFYLKNGYLYLFPVNQPYRLMHDPAEPLQCLWFHITTLPMIVDSLACIEVQTCSPVFYLLKTLALIVARCDTDESDGLLLEQLLGSLMHLLHKNRGLHFLDDERVGKVMNFIHRHYHQRIFNEELAQVVRLDPSYFIRYFKKSTGITPQQYITNYRFSKAESLLQNRAPVIAVARSVGFEDAKAFSRAFKKSRGISPSEYVKSQYLQP